MNSPANEERAEAPDIGRNLPERERPNIESLVLGMDRARSQIADWLDVELHAIQIEVWVFDDKVGSRVAMPADTIIRTYKDNRHLVVERSDRDVKFYLIEHGEPRIEGTGRGAGTDEHGRTPTEGAGSEQGEAV